MDKKDGRGNVRYLWVLVGAYLVYLAYEQAGLLLQGEVKALKDVAVCVISALMFAAVGVWVVYREWAAWRDTRTRKEDPDAWDDASDDDEDDAPKLRSASDRDDGDDEAGEDDEESDEDGDAAADEEDDEEEEDDEDDDGEEDDDDDADEESDDEEDDEEEDEP